MQIHHLEQKCCSVLLCLVSFSFWGCGDVTTTPIQDMGTDLPPIAGMMNPVGGGMNNGGMMDNNPLGGNNTPSNLKDFGESCDGPAECASGLCYSTDASVQGVCTEACDPTNMCPEEGWACESTTSLGEVCVPVDPKRACEACEEDWECGDSDDYCVPFIVDGVQEFYCTESCTGDADCPAGYSCVDYLGEVNQCYPDNGVNQCDVMDEDGDGVPDTDDNCPSIANPDQANSDNDVYGDACDNCPDEVNDDQADSDGDGYGDVCDVCPKDADPNQVDGDMDGYGDVCDNCPNLSNPDQADADENEIGDLCEEPVEIQFLMGSTLGGGGVSSSQSYSLIGGIGSHRAVMVNVDYRLTAYPEAQ